MVFGNSIVYLLKGGYNMKTRAGTFLFEFSYVYVHIYSYMYTISRDCEDCHCQKDLTLLLSEEFIQLLCGLWDHGA